MVKAASLVEGAGRGWLGLSAGEELSPPLPPQALSSPVTDTGRNTGAGRPSPRVGLLHEGRDPLVKGRAYCTKAPPTCSTKAPPTCSTPNPPPAAPHPRALRAGNAGPTPGDRDHPAVDGAEDGTWRSERVAVEVQHPDCGITWMSFALSTGTVPDSPEPPTCHSPASLAS